MSQQAKRYKVKIDGNEYIIAGPGSQALIDAAQQLLNEQYAHIKKENPELSELQRANLVAFNAVADQINKQAELNRVTKESEVQD